MQTRPKHDTSENNKSSSTHEKETETRTVHSATTLPIQACRTLFITVQVIVTSSNDHTVKVRALIDQRSEVSLITERIVQQLNIICHNFSLVGIRAKASNKIHG